MSGDRPWWVAGLPTEADMESDGYHPAEEMPQGPIPTGAEFRVMRQVLGLSLAELADRVGRPVHRVAEIEGRAVPRRDVDELVLHTVLVKSGVRWNSGLARLATVPAADGEVQDWSDVTALIGDEAFVGVLLPGLRVGLVVGGVLLEGNGIDVILAYPFDPIDLWDVALDIVRTGRRTAP